MRLSLSVLVLSLALLLPAGAVQAEKQPVFSEPLWCLGNEPSWRLLINDSQAEFSTPEAGARTLSGDGDILAYARPQQLVWRGRIAGNKQDLVAFIRNEACSDTMSDNQYPLAVTLSTGDGLPLSGCCRLTSPHMPSVDDSSEPALHSVTSLSQLVGHNWRLIYLGDAEARQTVTLQLQQEQGSLKLIGDTGCNRYFSDLSHVTATELRPGPVGMTRRLCAEQDMMAQEMKYVTALGQITHWEYTSQGELVLSGDSVALRFAPAGN